MAIPNPRQFFEQHDHIPPDVERALMLTDDARNGRAAMQAYPQVPSIACRSAALGQNALKAKRDAGATSGMIGLVFR